jgi:endoglucanase
MLLPRSFRPLAAAALGAVALWPLGPAPAQRTEGAADLPTIAFVGPIAADILSIEVQAGRLEPTRQVPYVSQPGDEIRQQTNRNTGEPRSVTVVRGGTSIGYPVGRDRKLLSIPAKIVGQPLDEGAAGKPENYVISSLEDGRYSKGLSPSAVWRKTKPDNWAGSGHASRHYLYLKLPHALQPGKRYSIDVGLSVAKSHVEYVYRPDRDRSEAVHVTQVGFRPDDPGKSAFLSAWLGTGGPHAYASGPRFHLREESSGRLVYTGPVTLAWKAADPEQYGRKINFEKTDVYRMDFGGFRRPGRYRVCVEGVGCGYPFDIAPDAWLKAFQLSMKGHYHQRNGIEFGPPYTTYVRPRGFHPDDGVKVYQSTCPLMYSGNGLNILGTERNNFDCLVQGRTDQVVPNAWGGYMDAGDWDRRAWHLDATRLHLELMGLFPAYFRKVSLNIPESGNDLPDVIDEALFNLDCYRRLQTPEGNVRGGIESSEHPTNSEASWQESQMVLTYAPGIWESYIYAGVAARAGHVLRLAGRREAETYRESALKAMRWAESEYARWKEGPDFTKATARGKTSIEEERNLAAVELYRFTGDKTWHDLFLATTDLNAPEPRTSVRRMDAAFAYSRLDAGQADPAIRSKAEQMVLRSADDALRFADGNVFRIAKVNAAPRAYGGFYTVPADRAVARAHALTGKAVYLEALIRSSQFSAGANPMNMTMTTGLGHDYPRNPLHVDTRSTGQPAPSGITVYGPLDLGASMESVLDRLQKECVPPALEWPVTETYFDVWTWVPVNEYTVHETMGPTSYVWGYLAARK